MRRKARVIEPDKWYIVDLTNRNVNRTYKIIRAAFKTKSRAIEAIQRHLNDREIYFDVIKGKDVLHYEIPFVAMHYHGIPYLMKYDYPPEALTYQDKKSFRTKYRRWLRNYKRPLPKFWHKNE